MALWDWLRHILGVTPLQPSYWYNWWSGAGSDMAELAILGGLAGIYRKHACHEPWCFRLGRHPVEGTPFRACRKHHPALKNGRPRRGHMTAAWHAAQHRHQDPGCASPAEKVRAQNSAAEISDTQAREGNT